MSKNNLGRIPSNVLLIENINKINMKGNDLATSLIYYGS